MTVFRQREGISQKHKLAVIQVTIKTLELNLKRYLYIESRIIIVLNIVSIQFWKSKRLRSIEASRLRVHVWSFIWPGVWKRERERQSVCVCVRVRVWSWTTRNVISVGYETSEQINIACHEFWEHNWIINMNFHHQTKHSDIRISPL